MLDGSLTLADLEVKPTNFLGKTMALSKHDPLADDRKVVPKPSHQFAILEVMDHPRMNPRRSCRL
jgi:hypothetical protein